MPARPSPHNRGAGRTQSSSRRLRPSPDPQEQPERRIRDEMDPALTRRERPMKSELIAGGTERESDEQRQRHRRRAAEYRNDSGEKQDGGAGVEELFEPWHAARTLMHPGIDADQRQIWHERGSEQCQAWSG